MEKRGCTRLNGITVDTELAAASNHCPDGDKASFVRDTTSAAIERKADGSLAKVNGYTILHDLKQSSSTEVKLCRLTLPDGKNVISNDLDSPRHAHVRGSNHAGDSAAEAGTGKSLVAGENDEGSSDLYAMKIYDRAKIMRRGSWFARRRHRGPEGVALLDGFLKVQREIAIMKKLVHPNIVQLVEVIDAPLDSFLYIVMEYVARGAVMRCIEPERGRYASPITGGCLDESTAARYFADILVGLEFLHLQLIAHRDLKPENVLLGNDDRAKIADFGVSEHFTDDESRSPKSPHSLARSSSRAQVVHAEGTWSFWAPEMCGARGEGVAFNAYAADAWAAGVTLWCFLYGTVPFFSSNPMDLFLAIASDPVAIPNEADEELRDILGNLLEKRPEQRLTVTEARAHSWICLRRNYKHGGFNGYIPMVDGEDVVRGAAEAHKNGPGDL